VKIMIKTVSFMTILLAATPACAQTYSICPVPQPGQTVVVCTPYTTPSIRRYDPEAERALRAERNYYDRAYEYELRRLDQENRATDPVRYCSRIACATMGPPSVL
jgi:hypothetical protein